MQKILLLFGFFAIALQMAGQTDTARLLTGDDYGQKSKRQKEIARTLLLAGGGFVLTALVIPRGEVTRPGICVFGICDEERASDNLIAAVGVTGAIVALSSIPLFIASKRNSRKATDVGLHMERAVQLSNQNLVYRSFPAVRLRVCF